MKFKISAPAVDGLDTFQVLNSHMWILATMLESTKQIHYLRKFLLEVPAREIRQENEMKHTQTRKEEIKLSLFTDIMTLCIENAKGFIHTHTHKLLELINEFSKFCRVQNQHTKVKWTCIP